VAHFLEGAGDSAVLQAEVSSGLLVGVAFGEERENFAIALGGIARRLKDEEAGGLHEFGV
jgi:hypothetical protein